MKSMLSFQLPWIYVNVFLTFRVNNFAFEASSKCRGLKTPLNNQDLCREESQVSSEWSCEWRLSPVRPCNQQAPFWEKQRKEKPVSWKCQGTGTLDSACCSLRRKEVGQYGECLREAREENYSWNAEFVPAAHRNQHGWLVGKHHANFQNVTFLTPHQDSHNHNWSLVRGMIIKAEAQVSRCESGCPHTDTCISQAFSKNVSMFINITTTVPS